MAAYVILDLDVSDEEAYAEYARLAGPTVARFGGRLLVAGARPATLEGEWLPDRLAVVAFASVERATAWYDSDDYRAAREVRRSAARTSAVVVAGSAPLPDHASG